MGKSWNFKEMQKIIDLKNEGYTQQEIATKIGATKSNVKYVFAKLRKRQAEEIRRLEDRGIPLSDICNQLGITKDQANLSLSGLNEKHSKAMKERASESNKYNAEIRDRIWELKLKGIKAMDIAEKLRLSKGYIYKLISDISLEKGKYKYTQGRKADISDYTEEQAEQMGQYLAENLTPGEIAYKIDASIMEVRELIKKYSIYENEKFLAKTKKQIEQHTQE